HFPTGRLETPPRIARSAPRRRDRSGAGTHLLDQSRRIGRTLRVGREVPSDVARHPLGPRTIPGREGRGRESEGEETMTRTTGDRERSRLGESATGGLNTLRLESRLESEEEIRMAIPMGPRAGRLTFEGDFATLTFERTLRHPVEAVWEAMTDPEPHPPDRRCLRGRHARLPRSAGGSTRGSSARGLAHPRGPSPSRISAVGIWWRGRPMKVVVLGGSGVAGRHVVEALRRKGADAIPVSRRNGVDLATGSGLREALSGAQRVIDASSDASPNE